MRHERVKPQTFIASSTALTGAALLPVIQCLGCRRCQRDRAARRVKVAYCASALTGGQRAQSPSGAG